MLSRRLLRIKTIKALYAHFKSDSDSLLSSEKNLIQSIDKTYDLYFQMLRLVADVARYAEARIELARNKKLPTYEALNPNLKFVQNPVIRQIDTSALINDFLSKRALGWVNSPELIKSLYNGMVGSDYYAEYMASPDHSYKKAVKLVMDFYLNQVEDNPLLEEVVEEQSIFWCDDIDFSLIMVMRTLDACKAGQEEMPVLPKFKSEEDLQYTKELFRKTLVNYDEYMKYIERFTQNWDVERIAFMDNLIMATAVAELINFDSIPVRVTLDEFIEISKYYSTPGSSVFINGIIDRIAETLTAEGRINKFGRGLI